MPREGEIILKKYSPIGELSQFAGQYVESLAKTTGFLACVTDKDHVIAAAGSGKKEFEGRQISPQLEEIMEAREHFVANSPERSLIKITADDPKGASAQAVSTIICEGDAIGAVILYNRDGDEKMGTTEEKLVRTASGFLGKQMEQ